MAEIEIDWDVFFAAGIASDPVVRAIMLQVAQEILDTTGKAPPGVVIGFKVKDSALVPFALDGDWEPLISYIEQGGDINHEIRNFILDVLRGKVRRPNHRPRRAATLLHHAKIAWHVSKWRADGLGPEASIQKAIDVFGIDRTTVQRALKDCAD